MTGDVLFVTFVVCDHDMFCNNMCCLWRVVWHVLFVTCVVCDTCCNNMCCFVCNKNCVRSWLLLWTRAWHACMNVLLGWSVHSKPVSRWHAGCKVILCKLRFAVYISLQALSTHLKACLKHSYTSLSRLQPCICIQACFIMRIACEIEKYMFRTFFCNRYFKNVSASSWLFPHRKLCSHLHTYTWDQDSVKKVAQCCLRNCVPTLVLNISRM